MIKHFYKSLSAFFLTYFLVACSSPSSEVAPSSVPSTRDALYSNTALSPSDVKSNFYLPLTSSLTKNIRAVGGEVYQSGSFVTIVIPSDALFESGTSTMLPNADALMIDVAKIIVRFPGDNVIITAHTDNIGSAFSQATRTREQAQLFALILWQQDDVDLKTFQRFKYAGMGSTQPITEDPSPHGQRLNCRVQITIYPSDDMKLAGS